MRLTKLRIKNFRSYRDSGEVSIPQKTVFVGENNAGKSNALKAIDLIHNISPRTPHSIDDSYRKKGNDIEIEAEFSELSNEQIAAFDKWTQNERFWLKTIFPFDKDGAPTQKKFEVKKEIPKNSDFRDLESKPAEEVKELYDKHEEVLQEYKVDDWSGKHKKYIIPTIENYVENADPAVEIKSQQNPKGIKDRLSTHLPDFRFFKSDRNIEQETKTTTGAVLGQLLQDAIDDVSEEAQRSIRDSLEGIDEKLNKAEKFDEILTLEEKLSEKLNQQIPVKNLTLDIQIPTLEDILSNVNVVVDDGVETDIRTMGAGLHMAFILSCLWELSERGTNSNNVIFGLEEPENDLHPHAQRQLYDTLEDLVKRGSQVILSTHSAHLVSGREIFDILRVVQRNNESAIYSAEDLDFTEDQAEKIQRRMTAEYNELFFSKAILLSEGPTEDWVLPVFNNLLDGKRDDIYAFDRLGVTQISCDGKTGMKPFLRLANCYSIPTIALIDDDSDVDDGHVELKEEIRELATELFELPVDIEYELFEAIDLGEFCEVMNHILPDYDRNVGDLEQHMEGADISETEVMRQDFEEFNPSKPLFGKLISDKVTEDQLPESIIELLETTRETAMNES